MKSPQPKRHISRRKGLIAILCLIVILGAVAFAFRDRVNKGSGVIPSTAAQKNVNVDKTSGAIPTDTPDKNSSQPTPSDSASSTPASSNITLVAPSGSFVSNHHPNLDGSPAPSTETSTCTTTPGAKCYIRFTKDGIVKTLDTQSTDSSGSTSWDWDVKKAGFTPGTWQVTAIATLDGQTKSTNDAFAFEVQP